MKMMSFIFVILMLTGCATGQLAWTPEERSAITTRNYYQPYDLVFDKILNRFKEVGTPIEYADRENGIINTGARSMGGALFGSGKAKMNVNLTKLDNKTTRVSVNFHVDGHSDTIGMYMTDDLVNKKDYEAFFAKLDDLLNTKRDI